MELSWSQNLVPMDAKAVQRKLGTIRTNRHPFLGVVLNKFNIKAAEYGSYGGYGSYGEYGKKVKNRIEGKMGEERIELEKLNIVLFQSLAVYFRLTLWVFLRMQNTRRRQLPFSISCIFVSFYISNIAYRFL